MTCAFCKLNSVSSYGGCPVVVFGDPQESELFSQIKLFQNDYIISNENSKYNTFQEDSCDVKCGYTNRLLN